MELVVPSVVYKESFLQALREYQNEDAREKDISVDLLGLDIASLTENFESYVKQLKDESDGRKLPPGYVSHTVYWLVDGKEFIGRVDIRPTLTNQLLKEGGHIGYNIRPTKRRLGYGKKILSLVLPKAKLFGLRKVLVTCDETNIASKKVIEANGGVFENSVFLGENRPYKRRYWIDLT